MKKLPFTLAFATATLAFSSRQKERNWTSNCEVAGDRFEEPVLGQKRSDAKATCNAIEDMFSGTASCELD